MPRTHQASINCWCRPEIHRTPDGITVTHRGKQAPVLEVDEAPYSIEEARQLIINRIAEQREARGWSQAELARRADILQGTMNQIENRGKQLTVENLLRITTALGIDAGILLGDITLR